MWKILTLMILLVILTYWAVNNLANRKWATIAAGVLASIYIILIMVLGV